MSYPYLSDLINHFFGTQLYVPIGMFGVFVAIAIIVSTFVAKKEVIRFEDLGFVPKFISSKRGSLPTHEILSDLAIVTAFFGIIGARIFHILEYPQEFMNDPASMIFSSSGFSFYGGLIVGAIAGVVFTLKRALPIIPMLDALAPSLMLGYGLGRVGCQISGDGDWGITANLALKPNWLPDWFWAQTYENNIAGVVIQAPGVYPTPLYEAFASICIFLFLWLIRKNNYAKGFLFSMYLLLSGFERLLIEKIRINSQYHFLGENFTQAELISTLLILFGLCGVVKSIRAKNTVKVAVSLLVFGMLSACTRL